MTLNHDRTRLDAQPFARVGIGSPRVGPIGDLVTVHPDRDVRPDRHNRLVYPDQIISHDASRILSTKDPTGTTIQRLIPIAIAKPVVDLTLVSVHLLARNTAKEDARIEIRSVRHGLQLQHEVTETTFGLQLAAAILHMQFAGRIDRELAGHIGI